MKKIKFSIYYEWQQWKANYDLNLPLLFIVFSVYLYFIYRYSWNEFHSIDGNIITFLNIDGSITQKIINNLPCILFYIVPIIYIGKVWGHYMKSENIMVKIRQLSSRQHFVYGEIFICVITLVWFIINALLFRVLHLSFGNSLLEIISSILLSMIFYNILLFLNFKDAFYIGWIILILINGLLLYHFPSIVTLLVLFLAIIVINDFEYQKSR